MLQETSLICPKSQYALLKEYALFHFQANKRLITQVKTLPSNTEIKGILLLIWQVESAWFACLHGHSNVIQPSGSATDEEILEGFAGLSNQFSEYVSSLNETQIKENVYVYIPGVIDCHIPRYEIIQICFDHSKYYHEQIRKTTACSGLSDKKDTQWLYMLH